MNVQLPMPSPPIRLTGRPVDSRYNLEICTFLGSNPIFGTNERDLLPIPDENKLKTYNDEEDKRIKYIVLQ